MMDNLEYARMLVDVELNIMKAMAEAPLPDEYNQHDYKSGRIKGEKDIAKSVAIVLQEIKDYLDKI